MQCKQDRHYHAALTLIKNQFLTKSDIAQLGFESIREARLTYYRRSKVLFDTGFEKDSLAIAHGALLLTLYTPLDDPVAHTYWLSIAIQHARRVHAFDIDARATARPERACRLQRLWWCCIIRDRSISLGLRRPMQIPASAVRAVPFLALDSFFGLSASSELAAPSIQRILIKEFNRYCALSVRLSDVLEILYPLWEPFPSTLPSKLSWNERYTRLCAAEQRLQRWATQASLKDEDTLRVSAATKSIFVLRKLSDMYYQ